MVSYNAIFIFIDLISLDKLKGVKDPLHGRPIIKQAGVCQFSSGMGNGYYYCN
jgi:hypothetical protein